MITYTKQEEKAKEDYIGYSPDEEDCWHFKTGIEIQKFLSKYFPTNLKENMVILNAGSGGECYGIKEDMIHLDIREDSIKDYPSHIVATITNIPLEDNSVDIIICVGSVINYTNSNKALLEFKRILKNEGILILEFERSDTADLLFTKDHHKAMVDISYPYQGKEHLLTLYSEKYILKILKDNNFSILKKKRFHVISSLLARFGLKDETSSKFIKLDTLFYPLSFQLAHNIILMSKIKKG